MSDPLSHLPGALAELEANGLRRCQAEVRGDALSFASNDYLGLGTRLASPVTSSAGAARLIAGEHEEHQLTECAFASWLGVESTLLFTSGYAANVGVVSALARPGDLIVSDALNHASLIDGARLSRAEVAVVRHNDLDHVDAALANHRGRKWIVVESYFSMDADGPDLTRLRTIADRHGAALVVDEAHALGVLGPQGRGRCAEAGVRPDVLIGTLGKAFGSQGAFAAGSHVLRDWLWNRARSFVFSTGLAPVSANAARLALEEIQRTPELPLSVEKLAKEFRRGLAEGISAAKLDAKVLGFGHVIPIVVGAPERAQHLSRLLEESGLDVAAIRPPTVPVGTSRLRVTVTARHRPTDIEHAIDVFGNAFRRLAQGPA